MKNKQLEVNILNRPRPITQENAVRLKSPHASILSRNPVSPFKDSVSPKTKDWDNMVSNKGKMIYHIKKS